MSSTEPTNTDPANTDPNNQNTDPNDDDLKPHERQFKTERDEARGERDTAQGRVTELLTREADRVAAGHLSNGPDWAIDGATLDDVTDDNGDVDPEKVKAVCKSVAEKRPGLDKNTRGPVGYGGGTNQNRPPSGPRDYHESFRNDHSAGKNAEKNWNRS